MLKIRPKIKAESLKSLELFLKMALSTALGNIILSEVFLNPCSYMGVTGRGVCLRSKGHERRRTALFNLYK